MIILVVNAGSSSIKVAIFESLQSRLQKTFYGKVNWEESRPSFTYIEKSQKEAKLSLNKKSKKGNLHTLFSFLKKKYPRLDIIGHRVVHGGDSFDSPVLITSQVKKKIAELKNLAPLHNPIELLCITESIRCWDKTKQVAVFDTSFYSTLLAEHRHYPLPFEWVNKKIKRYGFHGINHEYCSQKAPLFIKKRKSSLKLITCHLGGGSSISAIKGGKCLNTSMGFTPLDGVMMSTRPGSIDPGILLYILKNKIMTLSQLEETLNHKSGVMGVSGFSDDMRVLLKKTSQNPRADLAFNMFIYSVAKEITSMMVTLKGCDALIFSGGIGENAPKVRSAIIQKIAFLGFKMDPKKNKSLSKHGLISKVNSESKIIVIPAGEEEIIAQKCTVF